MCKSSCTGLARLDHKQMAMADVWGHQTTVRDAGCTSAVILLEQKPFCAMHGTADEVACCQGSASLVSEVFLRDPSCVCCKTVPLELRLNKDCLI